MLSSSNPGRCFSLIRLISRSSSPSRGASGEEAGIWKQRRDEERGVDKCPHETAVFPVVRRASMHGGSVDSKEIPAGGGEKLFFDMKIHFSVQYVNKFQFIMPVGNHLQVGLGRYGADGG